MIGHSYFRVIPTRVIPARREDLEKFPLKDLREYATALGVAPGRKKPETIDNILSTGKATMLAQLGD